MFGFLNVHKPPGPTSHDVVAQIRRRVGRKTKVGHAGTLDPFAEGVLVLCVGPATRLADYVQARPKRYAAVVHLGATSSTDDPEGEVAPAPRATAPTKAAVRDVLGRFVGTIRQVPPAHSAVHVNGRRAYQLARAGREVELPAREVAVHALELVRYAFPLLAIDVRCGSGTYVRALARELGAALGVGGYCERLTRTAVGPFGIDAALPPDEIDPTRGLVSPLVALEHLPRIELDADRARRLRSGNPVSLAETVVGEAAVIDREGRLLAIAEARGDGLLRPAKVFGASQ